VNRSTYSAWRRESCTSAQPYPLFELVIHSLVLSGFCSEQVIHA
jgi:hypothetical protein